jgi:glycosyltransferase involved in cell wall biosynthesis
MNSTKRNESVRLSVIMAVFNERFTLREIVERVLTQEQSPGIAAIQLIIIDDASTDGSRDIIRELAAADSRIKALYQPVNQGKTAAMKIGIEHAEGDVVLFQDADLEYDPVEYPRLLAPILDGAADVVYGSRFTPHEYRRVLYFWHSLMNSFLTNLSNLFTDLTLTDMETCYKVFRTSLLKSIPLRSTGFGIEPEITAKIAKRRLRIYEVPISYRGRTYEEGKKIRWQDGVAALYYIIKYWLIDDCVKEAAGTEVLHTMSLAPRFNKWMADVIRPFVGNSVLEIGAGIGSLTQQILPRDYYVASDIDQIHLDALASRFAGNPKVEIARIDVGLAEEFAAMTQSIDTVVCLNVLEHVENDAQALDNMFRLLVPGGRVVLLVPQNPALYGSLDRVILHFRRYAKAELAEKIRRAGFDVETVFHFNRPGVIGWFLNGRVFQRETLSKWQLKIYDHLVWLFRHIDHLLPWQGLSLIAVGRKPLKG